MDCEPPFKYEDYERLLNCNRLMSQEVREVLIEHCVSLEETVVLDEIEVSGVGYKIMAQCSDLATTDETSSKVDEVNE